MATYKLCSRSNGPTPLVESELDPDTFSDADYEQFQAGELSNTRMNELDGIAQQDQNFEWWIEKVE